MNFKKITLYFIMCVLFTDTYSQNKISNEFTDNHKLIKHSKIFLIPPADFHLAPNMMGYMNNETGANFGVYQFFKSYKSIKDYLSKKYLLKKGYIIHEITKYKINHLEACWYELESSFYDRTTIKYILIIGNKKEYAMIEAYCPKEYQLILPKMKKSIFSVYYDVDSSQIKALKK